MVKSRSGYFSQNSHENTAVSHQILQTESALATEQFEGSHITNFLTEPSEKASSITVKREQSRDQSEQQQNMRISLYLKNLSKVRNSSEQVSTIKTSNFGRSSSVEKEVEPLTENNQRSKIFEDLQTRMKEYVYSQKDDLRLNKQKKRKFESRSLSREKRNNKLLKKSEETDFEQNILHDRTLKCRKIVYHN